MPTVWKHAGVLAGTLALFALAAAPADAAGSRKFKGKRDEARKEKAEPLPQGMLQIVISIDKQRLALYNNGTPFAEAPVSTGMRGHATPMGVFSVIAKSRFHRSNLYAGAPMPFMQRITWSGVALHAGVLPGYPASHGCIRLPHDFAQKLFRYTRLGARVVIAREPVQPAEIAHAKLFAPQPVMANQPPPSERSDAPALGLRLRAAELADPTTASDAPSPLAPSIQVAVAPKPAADSAADAPADAAPATVPAAAAPAEPAAADAKSDTNSDAKSDVKSDPATTASTPAPAGETKSSDAPAAVSPAKPEAPPAVAVPAPAAAPADAEAQTVLRPEPPLPPGPVTVFVSRKTAKLYVRKGFQTLFDAPVTIKAADEPLGTHVFTALELNGDASALRWNVLSMPSETPRPKQVRTVRRHGKKVVVTDPEVPAVPVPAAAAVLDRIDMPADAVERISRMVGPGATLIVSDNTLSSETGAYTDFIVQIR